jgi:dipeptidase
MPLWIKPDRKISVKDMMHFMRDHLEGTELDMTKDVGAGPYGCPYRWRPLTYEVDSVTYCNERATSSQQCGFSFIAESRSWLPDPIGGIFWFGVDDAASSVYVPMYCGISEVPHSYAKGNGAMMEFTTDAAFWVFNQVANFVYTRYNVIHPEVDSLQGILENRFIEYTKGIDKAAVELYNSNPDHALDLITNFSVTAGNTTVDTWRDFYGYLFTKYMDGNIKWKDGNKLNPIFKQPGYGEEWYRLIVKETGDHFKVIENPKH